MRLPAYTYLSSHRHDMYTSWSATATDHCCGLIAAVSLHRQLPLLPLLQSMAGNWSLNRRASPIALSPQLKSMVGNWSLQVSGTDNTAIALQNVRLLL